MSEPTRGEREHYAKLIGRQIIAVIWEGNDGAALPILMLSGWDRDGNSATVSVLADPVGSGVGHLDHNL